MPPIDRILLVGEAAQTGADVADGEEAGGQQQAGDDSRIEQAADRGVRDQRIEDQRDRRRHQDVDRSTRRRWLRRRRRPGSRASSPGHEDRAEGSGIGHGRAGNTAEQRRAEHADLGMATAEAPDEIGGEVDEVPAELARHHQLAGHHEERDGDQRKILATAPSAAGSPRTSWDAVAGEDAERRADDQRVRNRIGNRQQEGEDNDHDQAHTTPRAGIGKIDVNRLASERMTDDRPEAAQPDEEQAGGEAAIAEAAGNLQNGAQLVVGDQRAFCQAYQAR